MIALNQEENMLSYTFAYKELERCILESGILTLNVNDNVKKSFLSLMG